MTSQRPRADFDLGDTYVLGLARVAVGLLLFAVALGSARDYISFGFFGDAFHLPLIPENWILPRRVYAPLVAIQVVAAALATVGHRPRLALFVSSAVLIYACLCDRLHAQDERFALACIAFLMSLSPCDRAFLIAASEPNAARIAPLWAMRLIQAQLSLIYVASGTWKLFDADWRGGLVLADAVLHRAPALLGGLLSPGALETVTRLPIMGGVSKLAIATELFLAVGPWLRRVRIFALFVGVWFHVAVQAMSELTLYTCVVFTVYMLFATPDTQARKVYFDPSRPKGVIFAGAIAALDWLARFSVTPWSPDDRRGHVIVVVRRDGTRATGIRAFAMVARCIPALFPIWAPLALIASFTKGGETSPGA